MRRSAGVDRRVVNDERGLQRDVLGAGELEPHGLAGEAAQRVGVLLVAAGVVEVGERRQRGQHRAGTVEYLHLELVELRGGGGGFRGVDVQPEAERGVRAGWVLYPSGWVLCGDTMMYCAVRFD